jgi:hypothetical protein
VVQPLRWLRAVFHPPGVIASIPRITDLRERSRANANSLRPFF